MKQFFTLVILSLFALACNKQSQGNNGNIIVEVGDSKLMKSELEANIPSGSNQEDSLISAENYIRSWIRDVLLYNIASKNISNKEEIEKLVDNYRRSLIIYQYKDQLVNEKLSREISAEELHKYYEENKDKFSLDRPLIKGIFLKIPTDAPQIDKVRVWYKLSSQDAIENIEKYSIQNAVIYDYFNNQWVDLNQVVDNIPITLSDVESTLKNKKQIELQDSSFYYFLNIKEYLLSGDNAPFEYAEQTIREILINQRKMDFLRNVEDDLFNTAQKKGQIKYYK